MAGEIELETLMVRIKGDGSLYQRTLDQATANTQKFAQGVSAALTMVARSFAALGAMHQLKDWLGEWKESEKVTKQLTAMVELNGHAVKETMASYTEFADLIQKQTKYSDESALSMIRQAEAFGLTGDAAKAAVQNAIALGALKGTDAQAFLRMTIAAQQGNAQLLLSTRGLGAFLKNAKTDAEKLAKVQEMLGKGFKLAQVGGAMDKLKNAISDVKEDLGQVVAKYVDPFVKGMTEVARAAKNISSETKAAVVHFMLTSAAALAIVPAFLAIKAIAIPLFIGIGLVAATQLGYVGKLFKWLGTSFGATADSIKGTWKGITDSIASGDLALAWDIVMKQIQLSFIKALVAMGEAFINWTAGFDRILNRVSTSFQSFALDFFTRFATGSGRLLHSLGLISDQDFAEKEERILDRASNARNQLLHAEQLDNEYITKKQIADLRAWADENKEAIGDVEKQKRALLNLAALNAGKVLPPEIPKQPGFPDTIGKKTHDKTETKIEAAAFGSAEALTRIEQGRDAKVNKTNELLKDIKEILKDGQGDPDIELAPVGLG